MQIVIRIQPTGRRQSFVRLTTRYASHTTLANLPYQDAVRLLDQEYLRRLARQLLNYCEETIRFGAPIDERDRPDRPRRLWIDWLYLPGTLRYQIAISPDGYPFVGQQVRRGERLGYIHNAQLGTPYSRQVLKLESPISGYVAHASLTEGSLVQDGDRILLLCESDEEMREFRRIARTQKSYLRE